MVSSTKTTNMNHMNIDCRSIPTYTRNTANINDTSAISTFRNISSLYRISCFSILSSKHSGCHPLQHT